MKGDIIEVFRALKTILRNVRWLWDKDDSRYIFSTVCIDTGQYERLIGAKNREYAIDFPALFIYFSKWRYTECGCYFSKGVCNIRLRIVLNNLDDTSDAYDTDGMYIIQRVMQSIQEQQYSYPCLAGRLSDACIEQAETFDHGLQLWTLTYKLSFKEKSVWIERKKKTVTMVMPPFTNHADQDSSLPDVNPHHHNNLAHPRRYDEATGYKNKTDDKNEDEEI